MVSVAPGVAAVAPVIVYTALPMADCGYPGAAAIALIVSDVETLRGPVYFGDEVVGMLPSVV